MVQITGTICRENPSSIAFEVQSLDFQILMQVIYVFNFKLKHIWVAGAARLP